MNDRNKPVVALIGRPNVGKSTLFNRITKSRDALVDDFPGVTRDRKYGDVTWENHEFTLVDTGGYAEDDEDAFAKDIRYHIDRAMEDADVVVLLLDAKGGISPFDADLVQILRQIEKPVLFAVNKIDGLEQEEKLYEFYDLGLEDPYPVSAEHGYGIPDFLDDLVQLLPETGKSSDAGRDDVVKVAVVGRPNVGKSSLINRILGEKRHLVSNVPGTTRDAVDSPCVIDGKDYLLIDTAGIRRKSKVKQKLEKFSVVKALGSLERCDVALIMIDAFEGITEQDVNVAGYAHERGCGCIFLLNKWDIVEKDHKTAKRFFEDVRMEAKYLGFAPILTISALTGRRTGKIFQLVQEVYKQYSARIGTGQLNKILEQAMERTEPSLHKGKRLRFYYSTQVSAKPPTFVSFVNYPTAVHFSYKRYLINQIREGAGLDKTPIRLMFRQRTGRIEFPNRDKREKRKKRKKKR